MRTTFYLLGLSNRCLVGEGTMVPVDEAEESLADLLCVSSAYSSSSSRSSKMSGASGGSLASCALAKDLCSSLMMSCDQRRGGRSEKGKMKRCAEGSCFDSTSVLEMYLEIGVRHVTVSPPLSSYTSPR